MRKNARNDTKAVTVSEEPADCLLRANQVAQMLAVSTRLVWRFRSEGKLPAIQIAGATRFRRSDVLKLMAGGTNGGAQ